MAQRTADYTGEDSYVHAGRVIGDNISRITESVILKKYTGENNR